MATHLFDQAKELVAAGKHASAVEVLGRCLAVQPDHLLALLTLAQLFARLGRYDEALKAGVRALDLDPDSAQAWASIAQILPALPASAEVAAALDRCLALKPSDLRAQSALIQILLRLGRPDEALELLKLAALLDQSVFAYEEIARFPAIKSEAELYLLKLALPPGTAERATYDQLVAANIMDAVDAAISRFHEDLGLDPHAIPMARSIAQARSKLRIEESLAAGKAARSPLVRFEAAWNDYVNGNREEAIASFRSILANSQEANPDPLLKEAIVRSAEIVGRHEEFAGNCDAALAVYKRILQLTPNGPIARRAALLLWRDGRLREAAELARQAIQTTGNLFFISENEHINSWKAAMSAGQREAIRRTD